MNLKPITIAVWTAYGRVNSTQLFAAWGLIDFPRSRYDFGGKRLVLPEDWFILRWWNR